MSSFKSVLDTVHLWSQAHPTMLWKLDIDSSPEKEIVCEPFMTHLKRKEMRNRLEENNENQAKKSKLSIN